MDRIARSRVIWAGLTLLALLEAAAIVALGAHAHNSSSAVAELARTDASLNRLDGLEWQAIAEGKISPELEADLAGRRQAIGAALARLGEADTGNPTLRSIARAYTDYLSALDDELAYLRAGKTEDARAVDQTQVDPAFSQLAAAVAAAEDAYGSAADRLEAVEYAGTVVIVIGSVLTLAFLFLWNQKIEAERQARVELKEAAARLEQRVAERTAELTQVADRLRSREAALAEGNRLLVRTTQQLRLLHEIDQTVLAGRSVEEMGQAALGNLRRLVPCARAALVAIDLGIEEARWLAVDTDGPTAVAPGKRLFLRDYPLRGSALRGQVWVAPDLRAEQELSPLEKTLLAEGLSACLIVPMLSARGLIGSLNLWRSEVGPFGPEEIEMVQQFARSLAVALEHAQLFRETVASHNQLQALSRRLMHAQEEERQSIARELHDEAGQGLTSLSIGLGLLEHSVADTPSAQEQIRALKTITDGVAEELHRLAAHLRPAALDRLGLVPAVRQHAASITALGGLHVTVAASGLEGERLPEQIETGLYRIVQEALTNALRHGRASEASVVLVKHGDRVSITVEDDGFGFDPGEAMQKGRLGLLGLRERAEALGGDLIIESSPGCGTTLVVAVPCPAGPDRGALAQ